MIKIPDFKKVFCNSCERTLSHSTLTSGRINVETTKNNGTYQNYEVFQCRECKKVTFSVSDWIYEGPMIGDPYPKKIHYYPPRLFRSKPSWYKNLDKKIKSILDEVYIALDNSLMIIACTGTRTALDKLIEDTIGDVGSFKNKIDTLRKRQIVTKEEKELLLTVIDAGSASAHRGFRPNKKTMNHIMDIVERIFYKLHIEPKESKVLLKKAEKIKRKTPKRKKI